MSKVEITDNDLRIALEQAKRKMLEDNRDEIIKSAHKILREKFNPPRVIIQNNDERK